MLNEPFETVVTVDFLEVCGVWEKSVEDESWLVEEERLVDDDELDDDELLLSEGMR